jgi:tetratricopeptide (TPR) repeat protein
MEPVASASRPGAAGASPDHHPPGQRLAELRRLDAENPRGRWFLALGGALRDTGRVKEALAVVRQGLARDPDCISGWVVLGQCYLALDELAAAERVLASVLRRDRENAVALRALAIIHARRGERNEAATHYRALLKLVPRDLAAQEALAALLEPVSSEEQFAPPIAAREPVGANGDLRSRSLDAPPRAAKPARGKQKSRFDPRSREPGPPRVPRGATPMLPPESRSGSGIFESPPHDLDWERTVAKLRDERRAPARRAPRAPRAPRPTGPAPARREREAQVRAEPAPGRSGALAGYQRWLERMIEEKGAPRGAGRAQDPAPHGDPPANEQET